MDYYIGVDPSITNTGVVILDGNGIIRGCINSRDCKAKKGPDAVSEIRRYFDIADYVSTGIASAILAGEPAKLYICYEDYAYDATHKAFSLGEYNGILKMMLTELGNSVQLEYIAPTVVKKFATGNGGAGKDSMVKQAVSENEIMREQSIDVCDAFFMAKDALYKNAQKLAMSLDNGNPLLRHRLEMVL